MRVITAPDVLDDSGSISVFLAGGITNCPEWQEEVLKGLEALNIVVYNPRRKNFPIDNPKAAEEQISWEFRALARADFFSMWFCGGASEQPICMYELGRHVALREKNLESVIVGVDPTYKRANDVFIQLALIHPRFKTEISTSLRGHIKQIITAIDNKRASMANEFIKKFNSLVIGDQK